MSNHTLPATFKSLYRLHMRGTTLAVLNHRGATSALRRLFRPAFEVAAQNVRKLQSMDLTPTRERQDLENWLKELDRRMDNNLLLLHASTVSRGLPHRLMKNISILSSMHTLRWAQSRYFQPVRQWNPQHPPNSPEYHPRPLTAKMKRKQEESLQDRHLEDRAWGALGETIQMAEGNDGLVLSRVRFPGRIARVKTRGVR